MNSNSHTVAESNVVTLRTARLTKRKIAHIEASIEQVQFVKREFCEEILEFVMEQLISNLQAFGTFQDSSKIKQKDVILLEQSVQSLIYRYHGLPHPLHSLVESFVNADDDSLEEDVK